MSCLLCDSKPKARGLCDKHYQKHLRGVLDFVPPRTRAYSDDEREAKYVSKQDDGCWLWIGRKDHRGFGRVGQSGSAHRWMYERKVGPIPEGDTLDHECGNHACVNPDHLSPLPRKELAQRTARSRPVCEYGHSPDKEEEVVRSDGSTVRRCRICAKYS